MGEWVKVIMAITSCVINIIHSGFVDCEGITTLTLPEGITSIGKRAFYSEYFQ